MITAASSRDLAAVGEIRSIALADVSARLEGKTARVIIDDYFRLRARFPAAA
jgi:hypothetical protein